MPARPSSPQQSPPKMRRMRRFAFLSFVAVIVGASLAAIPPQNEAPAVAQEELQIPGPDFPVGPTNWDILEDEPDFVQIFDGQTHVFENTRYLQGIRIEGAGTSVTLRNCVVINPGSFWTIFVDEGASLLMEDCQIGDDTSTPGERGVGGYNITLRRVMIVGHVDGIKAGDNSLYEQVWVTRLRDVNDQGHMDGLQDDGGGGAWTMRYSRIEPDGAPGQEQSNAAVFIKTDLGPIDDVVLENNIFDGGTYTVSSVTGSHGPPTNVVIRNNGFGEDALYGYFRYDGDVTWENNYRTLDGQCIDKANNVTGGNCGTPAPPPDPGDPPPEPGDPPPGSGTFVDDDGIVHEPAIEAIAAAGITLGCNPPDNDRYCPRDPVSRGQMAAFLARAFALREVGPPFLDMTDSIFSTDASKLRAADITRGCNPPLNDRYCPTASVTRGQMAAFLARHFGWSDDGGGDLFVDDDESVFEHDIDLLKVAGITIGCNPPLNNEFCPNNPVLRDQMATFLARALGLELINLG